MRGGRLLRASSPLRCGCETALAGARGCGGRGGDGVGLGRCCGPTSRWGGLLGAAGGRGGGGVGLGRCCGRTSRWGGLLGTRGGGVGLGRCCGRTSGWGGCWARGAAAWAWGAAADGPPGGGAAGVSLQVLVFKALTWSVLSNA
ncbi:glycine-rich protein 5-like [Canis lupus familiaris]|uniref:glycine-rich protein 5-like n=1 Tax=Canis lupus familiaris TaxID=9615 RepID=UPI0018F478DE|nr:glycine-rich protein 5-like [Canis lupus familiaris]XP_038440418.1 glycine-rich protein 5-like [Canis lupus familiaris]